MELCCVFHLLINSYQRGYWPHTAEVSTLQSGTSGSGIEQCVDVLFIRLGVGAGQMLAGSMLIKWALEMTRRKKIILPALRHRQGRDKPQEGTREGEVAAGKSLENDS